MANGLVDHGRGLRLTAVVVADVVDRKQQKQAGGTVDPGVGDHEFKQALCARGRW